MVLSPGAVFALALALSMDAFAVAVCYGLALGSGRLRAALLIGAFFGGFQCLMPLLGGQVGSLLAAYIAAVAPVFAFLLLAAVGGKMLYDARHDDCPVIHAVALLPLTMLAIATSLDALAVGFSLSLLGIPILFPALCIGLTTFVIAAGGVGIGTLCGTRWQRGARIAGGIILILIGLRLLFTGH